MLNPISFRASSGFWTIFGKNRKIRSYSFVVISSTHETYSFNSVQKTSRGQALGIRLCWNN